MIDWLEVDETERIHEFSFRKSGDNWIDFSNPKNTLDCVKNYKKRKNKNCVWVKWKIEILDGRFGFMRTIKMPLWTGQRSAITLWYIEYIAFYSNRKPQ